MSSDGTIASGSHDGILRLWSNIDGKSEYELIEELEGHGGYVTSICFNKSCNFLFSCDSVGDIMEWIKDEEKWKFSR